MRSTRVLLLLLLWFLFAVSCTTESTPVYQLSTSAEPSNGGIVESSAIEADEGESIQITATPNDHWRFDRWTGGFSGSENPIEIVMDSDKQVTALFVKREYPLAVNVEGGGTYSERVIQSKSTDYPHGTLVELEAHPDEGWEFVSWSGDVSSTEQSIEVEVNGQTNLTLEFTQADNSSPLMDLAVDWEALDSLVTELDSESNDSNVEVPISHFGIRLIYPDEPSIYIRSIQKETGDQQGNIKIKLPETQNAFLMAAVVSVDSTKALLFGTKDNLSFEKGNHYQWSIEDIDWVKPGWTVIDSLASDYEDRILLADKNESQYRFTTHVSDPFYPLISRYISDVNYEDSIIKMNGTGNIQFNEDPSLTDLFFIFENPNVGVENTASYNYFFPRLDGEQFNFPDELYEIVEVINMDIQWQ